MRDVNKELQYCIDLVSVLFDVPKIDKVTVSNRMVRKFGYCKITTRRNDPSYHYAQLTFAGTILNENYPINLMYNTMIHELLHLIDDNESGHSGRWLEMANEINDCYEFITPITPIGSNEKCEAFDEIKPKKLYQCECVDCGIMFHKEGYRAPKWYSQPYRFHCKKCGGHLQRV